MMLNALVVDDEPLARECITAYVHQVDFLQLAGTASHPVELTRLLEAGNIDLLFLDIQMPVMSGLDYLRTAQRPPTVIITTAYPSFALEGFELGVLDYLMKPVTFSRFFQAATKARDYHRLFNRPVAEANDYFFVKCDYKYERIFVDDVLYVQGLQNYVAIHTRAGKYVTLMSLKSAEENLAPHAFMRVHKSYVVSVPKIEAVEADELIIGSVRIPVSRHYRDEVLERVVAKKLWRRPREE